MAFKVSAKEHNEYLRAAVRAAVYLKETDKRFEGTNPIVPFFSGLLSKGGDPYIDIMCADSNGKTVHTVVFDKSSAKQLIEHFQECLAVLEKEEDK